MHYTFILEVRVNDPHYGDGDRPSIDTTYLSFRSVAYACNMFIIMDVSIPIHSDSAPFKSNIVHCILVLSS